MIRGVLGKAGLVVLLLISMGSLCNKNRPPEVSAVPGGPVLGRTGIAYRFWASATDRDHGDKVAVRFDWGDGDTSNWSGFFYSGDSASKTHAYVNPGIYHVRAQARDLERAVSEWSEACSIAVLLDSNMPPQTPTTPAGPDYGQIYSTYTFSSSAVDPEGDSVSIRFSWGDGDTSAWSYPTCSGYQVYSSHYFYYADTYDIRAQARDNGGRTSDWSTPHPFIVTTSGNRPPNTPATPSGPASGRTGVSYSFTSSAHDPDWDDVSLRFAWGDGDTSAWSSYVWSGEDVTMSHAYADSGMFSITAQAKDEYSYLSSWSTARSVAILPACTLDWRCATHSAGWSARCGHTTVVFNDKMWVLGGYSPSMRNDVWCSSDGASWNCVTSSAGWSGRYGHSSVVFDGKVWILGGYDYGYKNDVWFSSDGVSWTCATSSAGWSRREDHTSVVYDGKIWVLGGYDGSYRNDVWYSSDGANWTCATGSAGWSVRSEHTSVVFANKLWALGGYSGYSGSRKNDVWCSSDGVNWTCVTNSAGWTARNEHTAAVLDDKLFFLGGSDGSLLNSDVWCSSDGVNWTCLSDSSGWSARCEHTTVVFADKLWIIGGWDVGRRFVNDVWYWP